MGSTYFTKFGVLAALLGGMWLAIAHGAEPEASPSTPDSSTTTVETQRVSLDVARDRARVMHEIYVATLDVIHHRYFHGDRAIIPARAMEDVFAQMKAQSAVEARWISVNLRAMSLNHEPKTPFEKRAAEALATGQPTFDAVEDGYYRHAGSIAMADGCVSCHGGFFREQSKTPRFAGLVISIPLKTESRSAE